MYSIIYYSLLFKEDLQMIVYEKIIMGTLPRKFPYNLGSAARRLMFTINMQNGFRGKH